MYDRIEQLIGIDALNKINEKTVLVVGLGGVGGSSVVSLVRSGIKNIIIVDFDIIEESNLNRQVIAFNNNIGIKKVDATYNLIKSINKDINIVKYDMFLDKDNISMIFDNNKIDYVIDAIDSIDSKKILIMECLKRKIKFISSMGTGNKFCPEMLEVTDIRKTSNDPIARILRKWVKDNKINEKIMVVSSREVPVKVKNTISSLCFVPNTCGIMMASYIINCIIKEK